MKKPKTSEKRTYTYLMMMMMMMMMNCFYGMVERRKAFSLISSRDHCQISSPLIPDLVERSCAVVITTTSSSKGESAGYKSAEIPKTIFFCSCFIHGYLYS